MSWTYPVWKTAARLYCALAGGKTAEPGLRVLCYHAVGDALAGDALGLSVDAGAFARQMGLLAQGGFGAAVSLGAYRPDRGRSQVCVTFDDGFKGVLLRAADALVDARLPFTVCVTPGLLGDAAGVYLSESEVRELSRLPGAEIGAHGLTHRKLTGLDDRELDRELSESRERLEDSIGKAVTSMTYPHGAADRRVRDAARRAGFATAGCSRYGRNGPERDRLILCRTEIVAWDDAETFAQKLRGGWDWYRFRHRDPAGM